MSTLTPRLDRRDCGPSTVFDLHYLYYAGTRVGFMTGASQCAISPYAQFYLAMIDLELTPSKNQHHQCVSPFTLINFVNELPQVSLIISS